MTKAAMQHTPGPWTIVPTVHSDRKHIFHHDPINAYYIGTLISGSGEDLAIFKANVQLIGAAPELLRALEKAITAMNNTPNFDTRIYDPATGRNLRSYQLIPELEAVARQARMKA
jgi:hypothetical protein